MLPLEKERLLVKKAKAGCQDSFTDLIDDCKEKTQGGLLKYLKNEELVAEVYQLTLIKAWKKIKTFKLKKG